jgi:catechol-2,3-dioxygenase
MDLKLPSSSVYPKIINHIAVSVPNLDEAVEWYKEVLGFTVVKQTVEFVVDNSLIGMAIKDIHGPRIKKMKMAG